MTHDGRSAGDGRPEVTRRDFLKTTGVTTVTVAAASLLAREASASVPAPAVSPRILGANDRIRVGLVGVKGMGAGHIKHVLEGMPDANVEIGAICDVWEKARGTAQAAASLSSDQVYSDYRRMLERKDLDVVVVATPDHTHAAIARAAMETGHHLYLQKPMTRRLEDAFELSDLSRRTGRLVQVGTQACTDPRFHRAAEIVRSGALGRVLWAQTSYCRQNPKGEWNYEIDPEATADQIDWKAWLGPAPRRPFSAERFFRWRKYWDYGNGVLGDLLPHRLAPMLMAMDVREYPASVYCTGGNLAETDRGPDEEGKPYGERREVGDTALVTVQFPSGVLLFLAGGTANERGMEDLIRGQKANLLLGGGKLVLEPERPFTDEIDRTEETFEESKEVHARHVRNLFEAMRGNETLNCPIEDGLRVQTIISMAEKSYRERRAVRFDPAARKMRA
ncbi:MAG TPA: Gfo/Idh/MocA family oxidoreductase [Vicinamibacteria bacterium]|nr:Gfo/Idh/MocA family oxidoreductase [Vicinamibacteria bacterium]